MGRRESLGQRAREKGLGKHPVMYEREEETGVPLRDATCFDLKVSNRRSTAEDSTTLIPRSRLGCTYFDERGGTPGATLLVYSSCSHAMNLVCRWYGLFGNLALAIYSKEVTIDVPRQSHLGNTGNDRWPHSFCFVPPSLSATALPVAPL